MYMKKNIIIILICLSMSILLLILYHNFIIAPYLKIIDNKERLEDKKINLKFDVIVIT